MLDRLECSRNENIKCPYCGNVDEESYEWHSEYEELDECCDDYECTECGEVFEVQSSVSVYYTSVAKEWKK